MTMPIGMSDLRGIPPDKRSYWMSKYRDMNHFEIVNTQCCNQFMNLQHDVRQSMKWYELSDGSFVLTNHSSLKALYSKLSQQLKIHVQHKNFDDVTLIQPYHEHSKNGYRCINSHSDITAQKINIEHNPQDFTLCTTPPMSPTQHTSKKCLTVQAITEKKYYEFRPTK